MARFSYQARDGRGELVSGSVIAVTLEEAGKMLRGEGKFIIKLQKASESNTADDESPAKVSGSVKRADVIFFAHQMAVMIETGVPISDALECVVDQAQNPKFKIVLRDVANMVQAGNEFSAALRKYPKVFPPVMTSLIRASEVSGTMGTMLDRISKYMGKEQATMKQAKGAMMYPLFMMFMAVSVTIFLLAFVLPRFTKIYGARGATLPAPTRLLIAISDGLVQHWILWIVLAIATACGLFFGARTNFGRHVIDWLKLHTPVLGTVFTNLYVTRACRTLGTMTSSGVAILDSIAIVRHVTANVYYEQLWDNVDERLRQGSQLSDTLFQSKLLPRSVVQMIHSGEKSGRLSQVLDRVAEFTEREFDQSVKTATQFIEPVMIAVMGSLIGFVAISLLLPIFSVSSVVSGQ